MRKMITLPILALLVLINAPSIWSLVTKVDCKDANLNKLCACYFDDTQNLIQMTCKTTIKTASQNLLPDIPADAVIAQSDFTVWPSVPSSYLNVTYLDLSYGSITSLANVTNLMNLKYLILVSNSISSITPDICKMKNLNALDLSSNALTNFTFESMICDPANYSSTGFLSNLQYLILYNNLIKSVYSFDLVFFAFPNLNILALKSNPITDITISSLSNKTVQVVNELKSNLNSFPNYFNPLPTFYLDLTTCALTHLKINFQLLYATLTQLSASSSWLDTILQKFASIDFYGNNIACDCDIFNDYYYLLTSGNFNSSIYYKNITNSSMGNNVCVNGRLAYFIMTCVNSKPIFFNFFILKKNW